MKCTLEIAMDNDAFTPSPGPELARILRIAARKVEGCESANDEGTFPLFDANGNKVGFVAVSS